MELDPGTFDIQKLEDLSSMITRFSMGVQTFNKTEFNMLGRGHSFDEIEKSIDILKESKVKDSQISIDLMQGIPL